MYQDAFYSSTVADKAAIGATCIPYLVECTGMSQLGIIVRRWGMIIIVDIGTKLHVVAVECIAALLMKCRENKQILTKGLSGGALMYETTQWYIDYVACNSRPSSLLLAVN